jgi:hypothetical protein
MLHTCNAKTSWPFLSPFGLQGSSLIISFPIRSAYVASFPALDPALDNRQLEKPHVAIHGKWEL